MSSSTPSVSLISNSPMKKHINNSNNSLVSGSHTTTINNSSNSNSNKNNHNHNIRVVVRIRPLHTKELLHQSQSSITTLLPVVLPSTSISSSSSFLLCNDNSTSASASSNHNSNIIKSESVIVEERHEEDEDDTSITLSTTGSTTSSHTNHSSSSRQRSILFSKFPTPKLGPMKQLLQLRSKQQQKKKKTKNNSEIGSTTLVQPSNMNCTTTNGSSHDSIPVVTVQDTTTTKSSDSDVTTGTRDTFQQEQNEVYPTICIAANRQYEFDTVYGPTTTNDELYHHCFGSSDSNNFNIISNLFPHSSSTINTIGSSNRINHMTIIAYGMTGTGKTYTMNHQKDGVLYHIVHDLFHTKQRNMIMCEWNDSSSTTTAAATTAAQQSHIITIRLSCYEIYADEIHDLLVEPVRIDSTNTSTNASTIIEQQSPQRKSSSTTTGLKIRDHGELVSIVGLNEVIVNTMDETLELLSQAQQQRMTCCTLSNDGSSRSHAIYTFTITHSTTTATTTTTTTKLTLVDLAGSERIKDSGVTGLNRKESIHINTDLFVLGKVISSLQEQKVHVPYRDSKLTRLLRNSLGGGCGRTIFIACVSPAEIHIDESLNTLRYAERARAIVHTSINTSNHALTIMTPAQIMALQEENMILRARITNLSRRQAMNDCSNNNTIIGLERGGIQLSNIVTKIQRAKQEAAIIRQHTSNTTVSSIQNKAHIPCRSSSQVNHTNTELQTLCASLRQEVDFVNSENDILRLQTIRLQDEIQRLRVMKGITDHVDDIEPQDSGDNDDDDLIDENNGLLIMTEPNEKVSSAHNEKIRSHAERLLHWADEAIAKNRHNNGDADVGGSSICTSNMSDGTDLRPLRTNNNVDMTCAIFRARSLAENMESSVVISNMTSVNREIVKNGCTCCEESIFSKQPDVVEFYLPKLRLFCSCGRKDNVPLLGSDPCRIENILRDWQVKFCTFSAIQTATDLLHAYTQNSDQLAKQMRTWRKDNGMRSVKTKSCGIALRIWARTCKGVIQTSLQHSDDQNGLIKSRPDFLDVALASDSFSVSTLGFCDTEN